MNCYDTNISLYLFSPSHLNLNFSFLDDVDKDKISLLVIQFALHRLEHAFTVTALAVTVQPDT